MLLCATLLGALPAHADFTGVVVGVADRATITILREQEQVKVRLAGIDAPEKKQAFGNVARQNMAHLVVGKEVRVDDRKKDRYGAPSVASGWRPTPAVPPNARRRLMSAVLS